MGPAKPRAQTLSIERLNFSLVIAPLSSMQILLKGFPPQTTKTWACVCTTTWETVPGSKWKEGDTSVGFVQDP